MAEAELEFLRAKLAGLMREDEEAVPQRPKVIEPLNLEGVASHIKKIKSSNDSMLIMIDTSWISTSMIQIIVGLC